MKQLHRARSAIGTSLRVVGTLSGLEELDKTEILADPSRELQIGHHTDMGVMKRSKVNEDKVFGLEKTKLGGTVLTGCVAIFDGHCGAGCSTFASEQMQKKVLAAFDSEEAWDDGEQVLTDIFAEIESDFTTHAVENDDFSGSVATVVLVKEREMILGYIGDCRMVHCKRNGKVAFETRDHRADGQAEFKRITAAGGIVENGRLGGVQPSRVFGDVEVKEAREGVGLIALPEVYRIEAQPGDFVVVASDGLWDHTTSPSVGRRTKRLLIQKNDPEFAAKKLIDMAIRNNSTDDISVAILAF